MELKFTKEQRYLLTKKRVERISKFYKHFAVYIVVNTFLSILFIVSNVKDGVVFFDAFTDVSNYKIWLYWGIGVLIQALNTFGINFIFNKKWEERKLKEYMSTKNVYKHF